MFGKLMKYELRGCMRVFLPLWGATLALALINGLTNGFQPSISAPLLRFFLQVLPALLLFGLSFGMFVMAFVLIIRRFFSGLLGDGGYLAFSLPATYAQHIASKLLTALIMLAGCLITGLLATVLIIMIRGYGDSVKHFITEAWNILSCMVGSLESGITSVISSDDQHIIRSEFIHELTELNIEVIDCLSVCRDISSVTVNHICINEVDIAHSFKITVSDIDRSFHIGVITLVGITDHYTFSGENIIDLADAYVDIACCFKRIQDSLSCRLQTVVMASDCSLIWPVAFERPRNNTSYTMLALHDLSCLVTYIIKLLNRNDILMRCNLQDRICAGINYQRACLNMLIAVIFDYFSS